MACTANSHDDNEFEQWKRNEPCAAKGSEHARNPIKYWLELQDRYPNLSKLALNVLSIPASSCECERCFSELGDLLEPRRQGISPELLAATQCTRRWIKVGLGCNNEVDEKVVSNEQLDAKYGLDT
ncbi:Dimer-Tnp-hAT dimerization containing protein [Pyrenophora tritici-repentis]|nr:Dimer-Tnp-hAT dimerization containing protein [Pyrenophora tritici-repentis]